jgi:hypothetical protein
MKIELTVEQINIILNALGNGPYVQVAPVIAEIQKQAAPQAQNNTTP